MKAHLSLGIYVAVLAVSAVVAYLAFLPDAHESTGKILVLDATSRQVDNLEYKTAKQTLKAVALKDHSGFRLTVTENKDVTRSDKSKSTGDSISSEKNKTQKISKYRASKDFGDALKRVMPLEAIRDLGVVSSEKLKEFGLSPPEGWLSFSIGAQKVKFRVGKKTYGHSSFYLQQEPNGPVSLVSSGLLKVVDFRPPRYKELRLLGVETKKISRVVMDCGSKGKRTFIHEDRFGAKADRWVPEDDRDSTDSLYGNWMKKFLRQSLVEYLDATPATNPASTCNFVLSLDGGDTLSAELAWVTDPTGKSTYYGHSDFSIDWVRLEPSTAGSVVADIQAVLGKQADTQIPPK